MMVLYSGTTCPFSHRCRFVLFEKGMDFEIRDVDLFAKPEDIALMNPYNEVPILVERDLILYESHIINEYIDERFPHPQLMPADPVMRARARLFLFRFEQELFVHVKTLENGASGKEASKAREAIRDGLVTIASTSAEGMEEAKRRIEGITAEAEVGKIYEGPVVKLLEFGALVNILPGKDGLLHISEIASERVKDVKDYLQEGQVVRVKLLAADERGRLRLSLKAACAEEGTSIAPLNPTAVTESAAEATPEQPAQ